MVNLLKFILKNKRIIANEKGLFNKDTLTIIKSIITGKYSDDLKFTNDQIQIVKEAFIISNKNFDNETPKFIKEDKNCIINAINKNINNANFVYIFDEEIKDLILNSALTQNFILQKTSPLFLRSNYNIALKSIRLDVNSADFINWDVFNTKEIDILIDELNEHNYILSESSPTILTCNKKIVLTSIKKNIENINYANKSMKDDKDVFKYLLLNGYDFENWMLENKSLLYLSDIDVMKFYFKRFDVYNMLGTGGLYPLALAT